MRLQLCAATLFCALIAPLASAQENIDCGYPLNNNERTYCAEKALNDANTSMEEAYEKLHAKVVAIDEYLPEHLKGSPAALEEAQSAWITFREKDCNAYSFPYKGGTRGNELYRNCMIVMTMQRTDDLQATLEDYTD
ncbi:lysozyme inhibitor LprI family protein [uncultured Roseibium sp.]|uniref:lysozyme inhibitor LprI family protein n=1 Tax=uncultured Roseibium sp. TaxID=1936171 RepID=UPI002617C8CE|nr:lysozyme inhibitor LprI family protein [uncultured Roseibium sp.]